MMIECSVRGCTLPKVHDRSCTRRTRKCAHQAGCPDLGSRCYCHTKADELVKQVRKLAYSVRRSRLTRTKFKVILKSFPKQKSAKSGLPGIPGKRHVPFYKAKKPDTAYYVPAEYKPRFRPLRLERIKNVEWIGFDDRVAGTPLEAPSAACYRRALARRGPRILALARDRQTSLFNEGELEQLRLCPFFGELVKPFSWFPADYSAFSWATPVVSFPKAKISTAVLRTGLQAMYKETPRHPYLTDEQLDSVIADAWTDMQNRLEAIKHYKPVVRDPALEAAGWY